MMKVLRHTVLAGLAIILAFTSACAYRNEGSARNQTQTKQGASPSPTAGQQGAGGQTTASGTGNVGMLQAPADGGTLPVRRLGNEDYVEADKLMQLVGFNSVWDSGGKVLKFGDNDAAFEIKMDSTEARKEEDKLQLKSAPRVQDGVSFIPVSALGDLLTDEIAFSKQGQNLVFQPAPEQVNLNVDEDGPLPQGEALNFGEDPTDPFKDVKIDESAAALPEGTGADEDGAVTAAALKNIDIPALLSRARTYLGVPYGFGTSSYSSSGRFDCSSYTQYLYGKYGVSLPRTARAQARLGNHVSRSSLRRGDLMYFYVPGRFQSNKTVGHVGIYIGNYKMIHSSPKPKNGVQITDINKAYWKRTYLYAKRVAY